MNRVLSFGIGISEAGREDLGVLLDLLANQRRRLQRVGAGRELNADAGAGMAVEVAQGIVILAAELDPRDVLQQHIGTAGLRLEDDLRELGGRAQPRAGGDRRVQHLRVGGRLAADLAGRDLRVLRLDRRDDVARDERIAGELVGVEPDPHGILRAEDGDVADALDAAERVLHVRDEIVGDVARRPPVGLVVDADDHQEVRAFDLVTSRPCCCTSCGRRGSACWTLFCTWTWAMSGLVPLSKVAVIVTWPLELDVVEK